MFAAVPYRSKPPRRWVGAIAASAEAVLALTAPVPPRM